MNGSNKSLNDLFREASAEMGSDAEGNLLSQSEIEQLLRNSSVRDVPAATTTIRQRLYKPLLSTPLRIGITAMTLAASIVLGILAIGPKQTQ